MDKTKRHSDLGHNRQVVKGRFAAFAVAVEVNHERDAAFFEFIPSETAVDMAFESLPGIVFVKPELFIEPHGDGAVDFFRTKWGEFFPVFCCQGSIFIQKPLVVAEALHHFGTRTQAYGGLFKAHPFAEEEKVIAFKFGEEIGDGPNRGRMLHDFHGWQF